MNVTNTKNIRIALDKNSQLRVEAQGVILPEIIQLCLAAIEATCKETLARSDKEDLTKALEEDMYEMINIGASTLLDRLFPHISARPDLTVDAIMKAEDELMNDSSKMQSYAEAYADSAQAAKDAVEHAAIKANLDKIAKNNKTHKKEGK